MKITKEIKKKILIIRKIWKIEVFAGKMLKLNRIKKIKIKKYNC